MMDDPLTMLVALGAGALMLAVLAWLGDWRRMRRRDPDAVGFMPWRTLFFWALLVGAAALSIAARLWLGRSA